MCKGPKLNGGSGALIGGLIGAAVAGPGGAVAGASIGGMAGSGGGMFGGQQQPKNDGMAAAYQAQANAAIKSAEIQANASTQVAQMALQGQQAQADAAIKSSQMAGMAGIIGSALGAHTTSEQIKQWLPHEVGAATIMSWDLAQKWQTTMSMKQAGYQNVAIDYALSGKSYKSLFSDPQWNALQMGQMTKQDTMASLKMFGIQSPSNPHGIKISPDDWIEMHAFKDPKEILNVDPALAKARNAEFAAWEQQMRSSGYGLLVDIYKNPQLGGSSILTMKGKEAMLDPAMGQLMGSMMGSGGSGSTNWTQAINALTQGEENPMTPQIKWAQQNGLIDKYGMINAGVLQSFLPPGLTDPPEFNVFRDMSEQEKIKLMDEYTNYQSIKIDPKLIREETLGMGVTRKVKLNEDGSIAGHALEGYMTNAMGEQVFVSMSGLRLQEWYDRQSMISGMGPLFPGMMAPTTQSELNGTFEPGFWGENVMAKPNAGIPGQPGATPANKATNLYAAPALSFNSPIAPKPAAGGTGSSAPTGSTAPKPPAPTGSTSGSAGGTQSNVTNPAAAAGGAPLAAGE